MKRLILSIILLASPVSSHAACQGLSNTQYAVEVATIMNQSIDQVDTEQATNVPYVRILVKKIIKYRNSDLPLLIGGTVDLASRCFARDAWQNLTGQDISREAGHPGNVLHWFQQHVVEKYDGGETIE